MYERLRIVLIGLCVLAVGLAVFERSIAIYVLLGVFALLIVTAVTLWIVRGSAPARAGESAGGAGDDS
ncbi:hypothetical protein [Conexibacter arvalis]|uniref:Uncharacterized protein n=1 Tax=Conexibacter arvalis TaxID=912552 RepID=A0A840IFB8_9ACTN|nr:hypothetical protein [Conexibacter arvalis]MBB4662883.1 hypothetical protein [Conexibacter arvalis]